MRWGTVTGRLLPVILGSLLSLAACSAGPRPPVTTPADSAPSAAETAVTPAPPPVAAPAREPTTVRLELSDGDRWRAVTPMTAFVPAGPAVLRFTFSRPPRPLEVEQALRASQAMPVRGLMQWADERTLVWQIAALPGRLDFYLGTAHDQEGELLAVTLPSVQVGEPPTLVVHNLKTSAERLLMVLPPDLVSVTLTGNGQYVDLVAWEPGPTRWDWHTARSYIDLSGAQLKAGPAPGIQPRFGTALREWVVSPAAITTVAGLATGSGDLVIEDWRTGRQQGYRSFVVQDPAAEQAPRLAWSADGRRVAALSDGGAKGADLIAFDTATGDRTVIAGGLPLSTAALLSWSSDGQTVSVGNLLVDTATGRFKPLGGMPDKARGFWQPAGHLCLFSPQGDWGPVVLLGQGGEALQTLGNGVPVGWAGPAEVYLVRWSSSSGRHVPLGE